MSLLQSSNEEYHRNKTHLSSSSLKQLLRDPGQFYEEWVLGNRPPEVETAAFTEGTLVHCLILEPEKVVEYVIYPGLRKTGKAYEEFCEANKGKTIVSAAQMLRAEKLYKAYAAMEVATNLATNGLPEHTMLGNVLGLDMKTRADYIVPGKYIVDVKTTAQASDRDLFKYTVEDYGYDLSAALYCEVALQNYGAEHDFYWLVLSKDDGQCHVYKASETTLAKGKTLMYKAIKMYQKCLETNNWTKTEKTDFSTQNYEVQII